MPDAWVDRPGTGNRLGGERAVRPGAAQAGSECCRLAVHFILFRSSLHTRYDLKLWIGSGDVSAAYLPG